MQENNINILGMKFYTSTAYEDEDKHRSDTVNTEIMGVLYPKADKYAVASFPVGTLDKLGLLAFYNNQWVPVEYYDNGYDDYGKLRDGKWRGIHELCMWSETGLERLANQMLDIKESVRLIKEITKKITH